MVPKTKESKWTFKNEIWCLNERDESMMKQSFDQSKVSIKCKCMLRWVIPIHNPHLLVFSYTFFKEICLSLQGYMLHKVKGILHIVDL